MKSTNFKQRYPDLFVIMVLLVLFSVVSTAYLDQFPKVWMDEAWNSTTAYTFQIGGAFRNLALVGASRGNQDVHFLQPMIVGNIVTAPIFALLGVGSDQGRLASICMGAFLVVGMYFMSRKIGGIAFAFTCTLFLIFDNLIFVTARTVRPEIFVAAFAIWELYLVLTAGITFWRLFLCGILLGISLYVHPNSFLVVIAILIIALSQVKFKQYGQILLPMGLGLIIGFLPYVLYVGFQDGANHFQDFWLQLNDNSRTGIITNTTVTLSRAWGIELSRYGSYLFFPYRLPIILLQVAAIGYAVYKIAEQFNRSFLMFILVHMVLFPMLISADNSRYLTALMPVMTILVVKMLWALGSWAYNIGFSEMARSVARLSLRSIIAISLALILFINQSGGDAWAVWQSRGCSYAPFITRVRNLVPAGRSAWGAMFLWFGFYDHPYRTEMTVNTEAEMNSYQPDYVILYDSEVWGNQTGVTKRPDPFYIGMQPVRELMGQLVTERGSLVGSVPNSCYGNVEIFKMHWPPD